MAEAKIFLADLGESAYRFCYVLGGRTLLFRQRISRRLREATLPLRRRITLLWRLTVVRRWRRFMRNCRNYHTAAAASRQELRETAASQPLKVIPYLFILIARACRRRPNTPFGFLRWIAPVTATVLLAFTIRYWLNTSYCLSLDYHGEMLGYISNTAVYDEAADMARSFVVNVDNSFSVDAVPTISLVSAKEREILDSTGLCDAILLSAGDSLTEATGLYVSNRFIGAVPSEKDLTAVLDGIKNGYYDASDPDQRAEFVQPIRTVSGLFPSVAVVSSEDIRKTLTAEAVVEKTYTVVAGDSVSKIALKNDMTVNELRGMNPVIAKSDMVRPGDVLTVQRAQPFLRVKVIKTIRYTEEIPYTTQYVNNTAKYVTYSKVKTKGVAGSRDLVAEITYLDGVEDSRKVVSKVVTKEPVTKVVERGTKPVKSQSGTTVVIGDGKTIGNMIWPVPICHRMSRGYGYGHRGLDICNGPVSVRGKSALAADGGVVIYAKTGWNGAYGNLVKIQHSNGLVTMYAHLQSISVVQGQTVSRGQEIGKIGSTGRSSGPHLHFEVIKNGVSVNPLNYVRP